MISLALEVRHVVRSSPPQVQQGLHEGGFEDAVNALRGRAEERRGMVEVVLTRLARRWTEEADLTVVPLRAMAQTCLPAELVMSVWRLFFSAWRTTARYAQEIVESRLC